MFHLIHLTLIRLHDAANEPMRRAGIWFVHGVGWPWSVAVAVHDAAAGQFHVTSVIGPIGLAIAGLIQAAIAADRWLFEKAERKAGRGKPR